MAEKRLQRSSGMVVRFRPEPPISRAARLLAYLTVVVVLLPGLAIPSIAETYRLTLAPQPPARGALTTASPGVTVQAADGATVTLTRSRGTESRATGVGRLGWVSGASVAATGESLRLTVSGEGDAVRVQLKVARKAGEDLLRYESEVLAVPGEWLPLWRPAGRAEQHGGRVYRTRSDDDSLWLLVETQSLSP
jgi:hypothetical protein